MPKCKWCSADIIFVETYNDEQVPVDATPARVMVEQHGNGQTWYAIQDGYTSHLDTCPHGPAGRPEEETDGQA